MQDFTIITRNLGPNKIYYKIHSKSGLTTTQSLILFLSRFPKINETWNKTKLCNQLTCQKIVRKLRKSCITHENTTTIAHYCNYLNVAKNVAIAVFTLTLKSILFCKNAPIYQYFLSCRNFSVATQFASLFPLQHLCPQLCHTLKHPLMTNNLLDGVHFLENSCTQESSQISGILSISLK